jgi:hypothetical protein
MEIPSQKILAASFIDLDAKSLADLIKEYEDRHELLFPEDFLFGASPEGKYKQWLTRVLTPLVNEAEDQRKNLLKIIRESDFLKDPDLLMEAVVILSNWFFPESTDVNTVLALIVIIHKMLKKDDNENG